MDETGEGNELNRIRLDLGGSDDEMLALAMTRSMQCAAGTGRR